MSVMEKMLLIAGPCAAESEQQIMTTAAALASKVDVFRAGVWKPRTRPGCFEGHGKRALTWLQRAKKAYGLTIAVEVGTPQHVEQALAADVDVLWLGARTTVNPFCVQQLADVLRGVNRPVWIKNPVCPDLNLWMGAIERMERAGVTQPGLIYRGFTTPNRDVYRQSPLWSIARKVMEMRPDLPILCDPSHMAGKRDLIHELCVTARQLKMNGLMIEVHPDPPRALSDAQQQLTPQQLQQLLDRLSLDSIGISDLDRLRQRIDHIDHDLLVLIARRMDIAGEIGAYKQKHQMAVKQTQRWNEVVQDRIRIAETLGVNADLIGVLYQMLHTASLHVQSARTG